MGKFTSYLAEQGLKVVQEKKLINGEQLTGDTSGIWGDAENIRGRVC